MTLIPLRRPNLSSHADYGRRFGGLFHPLPYGTLRYRSKPMRETIKEALATRSYDAIFCDTIDAAVNIPNDLGLPLIVNNHNVEHLILRRYLLCERNLARRAYAWLEYKKVRAWEKRICSRAQLTFVCSNTDRLLIQSLCPEAVCHVVPNVIDVNKYQPAYGDDGHTVLYAGGMDWLPNRDAVEFFASSILPRLRELAPGVRFVIAGRNPSRDFRRRFAGAPDVAFTGTVPDMRPEIAKAAVCVVPLRIGSGTRLKILEAAAMGKAVVSTSIGAEGLDFVEGKEIIRVDAAEDFARSVADLLGDSGRRHAIGRQARSRVQQNYSLAVLHKTLQQGLDVLQLQVRNESSLSSALAHR